MNIEVIPGTHESPAALMLALGVAGIAIDPIASGLWNQIRINTPPRSINLEARTAKELGLEKRGYRSAIATFPTWRTTFCPEETITHLALQRRKWTNGKRVVVIMEPLRFPEMMNDGYAHVFCLQGRKISAVNIHAYDTVPEGTVLITAIS